MNASNGKHTFALHWAETLHPIMFKNVKADSKIVTDAYRSYNGLSANYNHVTIKHTDGNYITIGDDHTNTIEGFWSLLKRGIIGIYHNVSTYQLIAMSLAIVITLVNPKTL
ncbi:MAG: family transposase [Mucilaginibacter sp.]|nr:family transposase [Mucilaginibacter sp.]